MNKSQVIDLQRALNSFTDKYLKYVTPLIVDGDFGPATKKRLHSVHWWLGEKHPGLSVDKNLFTRLHHPNMWRYANVWICKRGKRRRRRHNRLAKPQNVVGFGWFDGKQVAAWMVPWLQRSRNAGWNGTVSSGVRTPAYSEHLCYLMCGHPTCPGKCAGRSSNHNMLPDQGYPHGAVDVTDYINFKEIQLRINSPLRNDLPVDPVHFSVTGH